MGLSMDLKSVREFAKTSSTYTEFKMKVSVSGIDMYRVELLKAIFSSLKTRNMMRAFRDDVQSEIDKEEISNYALDVIRGQFWNPGKKQKKFDAFIANTWIRKHKNEYV